MRSAHNTSGYWKNSLWSLGSKIVAAGLTFLFSVIFMRELGLESYGAYVYVQSFVQLLMLPLTAMWSGIANLIISDNHSSRGIAKPMLLTVLIYSSVTTVIYSVFSGLGWIVVLTVLMYCCGIYFSSMMPIIFNAEAKFRHSGILQLMVSLSQFVGLISGTIFGNSDRNTILIVIGLATFGSTLFVTIFTGSYWSGRSNFKGRLIASKRMTAAYFWINISDVFMLNGSRLMFGYSFSLQSLAVFDLIMKFILLGRMFVVSAFGTLTPYFARISRIANGVTVVGIYRRLCALAIASSATGFAMLVFLGPWIEGIVGHHVSLDLWMLMLIPLCLGNSLHSATVVQSSMMFSKGNTSGVYVMEFSSILVYSFVYLVCKHFYGGASIAIGVGAAMGISALVYSYLADKNLEIAPGRNIIITLITHASIVFSTVSRLTSHAWGLCTLWSIISGAFYILTFVYAMLLSLGILKYIKGTRIKL